MTARIRHVTFDCSDSVGLAAFWREVTGYGDDPADPNEPGDTEILIVRPGAAGRACCSSRCRRARR